MARERNPRRQAPGLPNRDGRCSGAYCGMQLALWAGVENVEGSRCLSCRPRTGSRQFGTKPPCLRGAGDNALTGRMGRDPSEDANASRSKVLGKTLREAARSGERGGAGNHQAMGAEGLGEVGQRFQCRPLSMSSFVSRRQARRGCSSLSRKDPTFVLCAWP